MPGAGREVDTVGGMAAQTPHRLPGPAERLPKTLDDLGALRLLLRRSHLSGPDELPAMTTSAGESLGADSAVLYVADYDQTQLIPLLSPGMDTLAATSVAVDGTLGGRAYADLTEYASSAVDATTLWTPVVDGSERLGVLRLEFPAGFDVPAEVRAASFDVASLLGELVVTRSLCGDAVEKARRLVPLTVPAEIQWRQLPPLTFVSSKFAVAGVLAPSTEVAGDSFDYALNGSTAHVAIVDAMGHGMEATLLSAVAVSSLRNARRRGLDLPDTVRSIDSEIASQFGPDKFVTGIFGELDVDSGWWRWATCGHPPALLVRGGSVVKVLDSVIGAPLGLGLLEEKPGIGQERLEPDDRLLLYTDGVVEARSLQGDFFGVERLVELTTRQAAADRPVAETLRRLNRAILEHQDGALQDDATTVMVEWFPNEVGRANLNGE
jgi:phosphoserine phosphatase RsbU/P